MKEKSKHAGLSFPQPIIELRDSQMPVQGQGQPAASQDAVLDREQISSLKELNIRIEELMRLVNRLDP